MSISRITLRPKRDFLFPQLDVRVVAAFVAQIVGLVLLAEREWLVRPNRARCGSRIIPKKPIHE